MYRGSFCHYFCCCGHIFREVNWHILSGFFPFVFDIFLVNKYEKCFNPKNAGGGWEEGSIWPSLQSGFSENVFSRETEFKTLFFLWLLILSYFNITWKFHLNSSSRSGDMKIFFFSIRYFHQFSGFFDILLLQRN